MQSCHLCKEHAEFFCHGCNRILCVHHADEHRELLDEQFDWLNVDHEDLVETFNQTSLIEQTNTQSKKIIDLWEEESIRHIRQTADDARQALTNMMNNYVNTVKERLHALSEQLKAVQQENFLFDERNLQQWTTELHQLKRELHTTPPYTVRVHGNKPVVMQIIKIQPETKQRTSPKEEQEEKRQQSRRSFGIVPIKDLTKQSTSSANQNKPVRSLTRSSTAPVNHLAPMKDDRYGFTTDHVKILDHDRMIVHDSSKIEASIRGHNQYSHGTHQLFFRIENMTPNQSMFFGIFSKQSSLGQRAYLNPSANGWTGYNNVYINGKSQAVLNGYINDMKTNDLVELTLDCTNQTLIFWHSRQTYKIKLPIDVRTCPFPWQFLLSCRSGHDCVRILPSSVSSMVRREQEKLTNDMIIKEMNMKTTTSTSTVQ